MPNPTFPVLVSHTQDAKYYSLSLEDPAISNDMEGGYVASRARFTRAPRRTWESGFTDISNTDRSTMEAFWTTVMGGSVIFDWINPLDTNTYAVRFKSMKFTYAGMGSNFRWNCEFTVEEA